MIISSNDVWILRSHANENCDKFESPADIESNVVENENSETPTQECFCGQNNENNHIAHVSNQQLWICKFNGVFSN